MGDYDFFGLTEVPTGALKRQSSVHSLWDKNTSLPSPGAPGTEQRRKASLPSSTTPGAQEVSPPISKKSLSSDKKADQKMPSVEYSAHAPHLLDEHGKPQMATLTLPNGEIIKLPMMEMNTAAGEKYTGIDIRGSFPQVVFYDPGFSSTASCSSAITWINGEEGFLAYRGYSVEDLCAHSDYTEVTFLLLYGELPTKHEKAIHHHALTAERMVHTKLQRFFDGFQSNAHPMAIMVGVVGALSSFYHDSLDITSPAARALCAYRLIAQMPTIAATAFRISKGEPTIYPNSKLSYAENFLYMMFASPAEPDFKVNPIMVEAMETFLILHADHEQNASTTTVRVAGSSHANPFACIAAGVSTLWGPAHGGANEAVLRMLAEIGDVSRISEFIAKAKDKSDPFRLMGFGHRVYKNYDPRAKMMKKVCDKVLAAIGVKDDPLLELAMALEQAALQDPYFKKRKLFPNVDFYSGIVLKAMGIPTSMFTVLFAVGRVSGWISQWKEMIEDPKHRIARPRQLYRGEARRDFVPIDKRNETVSEEQFASQIHPRTTVGS